MVEEGVLLSVRGEAARTVTPDVAYLIGSVEVGERSKEKALAAAAAAQRALVTDLASLEGVPLTAETERSPLTWAAYSATSRQESTYNQRTGRAEATGRVVATVRLRIAVRELGRLQDLSAALAGHPAFHLQYVSWSVDDDNPQWKEVRHDAIQAALRKARDYAESLDASLVRIEQVADAGLLAAPARPEHGVAALRAPAAASRPADDVPSLDPVPQDISAVIEARVRTSVATLPG